MIFEGKNIVYKSKNIQHILKSKRTSETNQTIASIRNNKELFRINKDSSLLDIPLELDRRLFAVTETQIIRAKTYEFYHLIAYNSSDALTASKANKIEKERNMSAIRSRKLTQTNEGQKTHPINRLKDLDEVLQDTLVDLSLVFQLKNILVDIPSEGRELKNIPVPPNILQPLKYGLEHALYIIASIISQKRRSPMSEIAIETIKVGNLININLILKDYRLGHEDINQKIEIRKVPMSLTDCLSRLQSYLVPHCGKYSFSSHEEINPNSPENPKTTGTRIQISYLQNSKKLNAPAIQI